MEYIRAVCECAWAKWPRFYTIRLSLLFMGGYFFILIFSFSLPCKTLWGITRTRNYIYIESDSSLNDDTFLYYIAFFLDDDDDDGLTSVRRVFLFKFDLHPFIHCAVVNMHVNKLLIPSIALIVYANYLCTRRCDYTFIAMRRNIK